MSGRLEGKVALVTGAGRGLGVAIAEGLAREGASVAVHYRSSEAGAEETAALVRELGGDAMTVQGDIAVWDDVARVAEEVVDALRADRRARQQRRRHGRVPDVLAGADARERRPHARRSTSRERC